MISVIRSFIKKYRAGEYPPRFFRLPDSFSFNRKNGKHIFPGAVLDFLVTVLIGGYLVLYDVSVLSGKGRAYHLAVFLCSLFLSRWALNHPLRMILFPILQFFCDLISSCFLVLLYPVRQIFFAGLRFLSFLVLILKRKNDRIRMKRKAKRQIRKRKEEMKTAFLPPAFLGSFGTGE